MRDRRLSRNLWFAVALSATWCVSIPGTPNIATTLAPSVISGYGVRPFNWETEAGIQQEVARGISFNATYFRRWWGNFLVNRNPNWTPGNFDSFCTTAPNDSSLPGGGGYQMCGLYDVNPSVGAQVNNVQATHLEATATRQT